MKQIIPIFFTFDKNYAVAAAVSFYSLLKHANKKYYYKLYVLHTDISESKQNSIRNSIKSFNNTSIIFINTSSYFKDISIINGKSHFSKDIYCKLIAAELFPQYDRILCSDVDVIFTGDISPAYFVYENEFFYYAGVGQILKSKRMESYSNDFNSDEIEILKKEIAAGFLLINLAAIRKQQKQKVLTDFYKLNYHRLPLPEQDCIILCCWPDIKYLPMEYVVCNNYYKLKEVIFNKDGQPISIQEFNKALNNPIQLHYVGPAKPWNDIFVSKQKLWFSMLIEANLAPFFILNLPLFFKQKLRRYSLKRFIKKLCRKINKIFIKI